MNTNKTHRYEIQIKPSTNWNAMLAHPLLNLNNIPDNLKLEYQFYHRNS